MSPWATPAASLPSNASHGLSALRASAPAPRRRPAPGMGAGAVPRAPLLLTVRGSLQGKATPSGGGTRLRPGRDADGTAIRKLVWAEKMNPLGLDPQRFVVAEDAAGNLQGFGQLVDWPCLYDKQDLVGAVVRALNLKPNWKGDLVELRSVVVDPACRNQGVGSGIVQELLRRAQGKNVCLLTINSRVPFYEKLGFTVVDVQDVPRPLKPEQFWGSVVANIAVGDSVAVMARRMDE